MNGVLKKISLSIILLALGAFVFQPAVQSIVRAEGADLSFSPESGNFVVSRTFSVKVLLNSGGGVGVNAADGTVSYDPAYLSVTGITKEGSVFNLWTSEPAYSNSNGTITFSGGSPAAYAKSGGSIVAVTFKALKAGTTALSFSSASVLAADGKGTNVLSGTKKANYTITAATAEPQPEAQAPAASQPESTESGSNLTAEITSPTHPDEDKWYSNNTPELKWKLSPDVGGISETLSAKPDGSPPKTTEGLIDSKKFDKTDDGIWYFHLRLKGQTNTWSKVFHRKIQIDSTVPKDFSVNLKQTDRGLPPIAFLTATDTTSGVDHFEVRVNELENRNVSIEQATGEGVVLQSVLPGKHKATFKAVDRAGNASEVTKEFEIEGDPSVRITASPGTMEEREYLIIEGTSDKSAKVYVKIEADGKAITEESLRANDEGSWVYAYRKFLRAGDYEISAKMITRAGAESASTEKIGLKVVAAPFIERYALLLTVLLLLLLIILAILLWYERRQYLHKKELLLRETNDIRQKTTAIFAALNEETEEKLSLLDEDRAAKMGIDKIEPGEALDKLRDALDISEDTLIKEIDDVEKTLD